MTCLFGRRTSALTLALVMLAGCTATTLLPVPLSPSGPASPSAPAFAHYDGDALSFDYPGGWSAALFPVQSSFSNVLVYLSTAPMADPCDRIANSIACVRLAVAALGPDGVLVTWSRRSFPGWTFDPAKGRPGTVGGRRATLEQPGIDDWCHGIGAERVLLATIDDAVPDMNWTEMAACLRGPSLDALQGQVEAMLATVRWRQ